MKRKFTAVPKANQQANTRITAATNYKLIDKLVKDYEDDYVRGKALSVIWNEITKKHHDSKLARDVVAELEKTNKKVDYYDEDAKRDPNFIKDRKDMKDIKSGCDKKKKVKAADEEEDGYDKEGYCKKCGRKLTDQGECLVCEGKVAEEDFDDEIEGCDVMSATAFDLAGVGTEAENLADDLEEWLNAFLQLPEADGYISEEDLRILEEAHDILQFAAQAILGSKIY